MPGDLRHPWPAASWETLGFWEGCGRGELVLQRCRDCGAVQHPPRGVCGQCLGAGISHFVASGRGRVHTFTVTWQNQIEPFRSACPYVLAWVEIDEGPRILTNIVGCDPGRVRIGMPVEVDFARPEGQGEEDLAVPRFRPR